MKKTIEIESRPGVGVFVTIDGVTVNASDPVKGGNTAIKAAHALGYGVEYCYSSSGPKEFSLVPNPLFTSIGEYRIATPPAEPTLDEQIAKLLADGWTEVRTGFGPFYKGAPWTKKAKIAAHGRLWSWDELRVQRVSSSPAGEIRFFCAPVKMRQMTVDELNKLRVEKAIFYSYDEGASWVLVTCSSEIDALSRPSSTALISTDLINWAKPEKPEDEE